ncbi:hypothetical protein MJH12_16350, partial [bacterium]|nr:hypothetical protein [bacterium]
MVTIPTDSAVDCITYLNGQGILSTVEKIWKFNESWTKFQPNSNSNGFTVFTPNQGYWFKMSESVTLRFDSTLFSIKSLAITRSGWHLASFNQNEVISISKNILTSSTIDSNHNLDNIVKVWGYDKFWQKYTPTTVSDLESVKPGFAYWVQTRSISTAQISESNPLVINPQNSSNKIVFVIGGETTLIPPIEEEIEQVDNVGFRSQRSLNQLENRTFRKVYSSYNIDESIKYCTEEFQPKSIIGYAFAYTLQGELINKSNPAKVFCNEEIDKPLQYNLSFSKSEILNLQKNSFKSENIIITIQLNSGQTQKSIITTNILASFDPSKEEVQDFNTYDTNSESTLIVQLLSHEIAKKIKVSPDRFNLGDSLSGLQSLHSELPATVNTYTNTVIDILGLSSKLSRAMTDSSNVFSSLRDSIDTINNPENIFDPNRLVDKSQEINRLINGISIEAKGTEFKDNLIQAIEIIDKSNDLLLGLKEALQNESFANESNESVTINRLIDKVFDSESKDVSILDLSKLVSRAIDISNATHSNSLIRDTTHKVTKKLLAEIQTNSFSTYSNSTTVISLCNDAMSYPKEILDIMAQNKEAAKYLVSIYGQGISLLRKVQQKDAAATNSKRVLDKRNDIVSNLVGNRRVLDLLVEKASDVDGLSQIVSGLLESVSDNKYSNEVLIAELSAINTRVSTLSNLKIDFQKVMELSENSNNIQLIAKTLAMESDNISDVKSILNSVKKLVNTSVFEAIINDSDLVKRYQQNQIIFADAGKNQEIIVSGDLTKITLSASHSYDPKHKTLVYEWFEVFNGSERSINTDGTNIQNSELNLTIINSQVSDKLYYKVAVSDSNDSSRKDTADVYVSLVQQGKPVIIVQKLFTSTSFSPAKQNFLEIDASLSFIPNSTGELSFNWELQDETLFVGNSNKQSVARLQFTTPGIHKIKLTVSTDIVSNSQEITIIIKDMNLIVADAGNNLEVNQSQLISTRGLLLENNSISLMKESTTLHFEWTPKSYFSNVLGKNYLSRNPLFISTQIKDYQILLKVTDDSGYSAYDDMNITIVEQQAPFSSAGFNQTISIGQNNQIIVLDGSSSYSHSTNSLQYKWSGPTDIVNDTNVIAQIELTDTMFKQPTKLQYQLEVSDDIGSAISTVEILMIPQSQKPRIVIKQTPNRKFYKPGETIKLEAHSSFSTGTSIVEYNWLPLSPIEYNSSGSSLVLTLPNFETNSEVKFGLTVTDSLDRTNQQIVSLQIKPDIEAPTVIVYPVRAIMSFSNENITNFSCSNSYSIDLNPVSYKWIYNPLYLSVVSGSLTSSEIAVKISMDSITGSTYLTCLVTDLVRKLRRSNSATINILKEINSEFGIDVQFTKEFDLSSKKYTPIFDSRLNMSLVEENKDFKLVGLVYGTTSSNQSLTTTLYVWNNTLKQRGEIVE